MKRFRKIFTSLLLVFSLIFACTAVHAVDAETADGEYEIFFTEEDILNAWGTLTEEEQMDYAGVYIDGDTIVLLFKEGTESLNNAIMRNNQSDKMLVKQDKSHQQSIVIESATYSYNDLMAVYDFLVAEAYSLDGVMSVSLSNKGNCIDIGISPDTHSSQIQKKLFAMIQVGTDVTNIAGDSILSFHTVDQEDDYSYVKSINGNSQLKTTNSDGTVYYSAAVREYSTTYGEGFITTGHGPSVGDAVKCGLTTIGYVKEVNHDGTDDTAFVAFTGSHDWESITANYEEKISATPAEGAKIQLRGYVTTPYASAEVISNTFSYYNKQDGITWTDLIQADYAVSAGDSGGAAY